MKNVVAATALLLAATPALASWNFRVSKDPMTGARRGFAIVRNDDGALVVKCDENGPGSLYVSIFTKSYLGGPARTKDRDIKYRADDGAIQSVTAFHDGREAIVLDLSPGRAGGAFLSRLLPAKKFVVQVIDSGNETHNYVFDTSGAADVIGRAANECGDTNWMPQADSPASPPQSP